MSPEMLRLLTKHCALLYGRTVFFADGRKMPVGEFEQWCAQVNSPEVDEAIGGAQAEGRTP